MFRGWLMAVLALSVCTVLGATEMGERYLRYELDGETRYGRLVDATTVQPLQGDLFGEHHEHGEPIPRERVKILTPTEASKIVAVGLNYPSHTGGQRPDEPGLFTKQVSALVPHEGEIWLYPDSTKTHYEGEVVVVIGRRAQDVPVVEVPRYIFGITAGNDVSERNWQFNDLQWFRAKGADSFGPVGPFVATGLDYNDLQVTTRVNGEVRQSDRTRNMYFGIDEIVSYVSRYVTLEPGDLIYSGTPGSTRALSEGDVVEVEVEGVGVLRNRVVRKPR
jgi:2-keto-4-pentenoate hydratase/2-oxohepta-3-ene-1,7-dioic acid hydratase in catechol pathway